MGYVKKKHKILILLTVMAGCIALYFHNISYTENSNRLKRIKQKSLPFTSIEYVLSTDVCMYRKPRILILVTSHVLNKAARTDIRQSYPRDLFRHYNAQIVFLLAQENTPGNQIFIQKEFVQFNDMIQGNFTEAYRNLTYKHYMGLKWSKDSCTSAKYVVKMDDDIVINYYVLFYIINQFKNNFQLMGHIITDMKPIRDASNKWYVTGDEYTDDEYPAFVSGWMYVTTSKAIKRLIQQADSTNFFWIDDVFITGIVRKRTGIQLTDIKRYFRYEPKNIECCIENKYSCHFVAAPSGKNYELNVNFNTHLWECRYKKTCTLESSLRTSCLATNNFIPIKGYFKNFTKI